MPAPAKSEWLRVNYSTQSFEPRLKQPVGVDRNNNRINGFIVAQEGPFKSEGRGEFNEQSLQIIESLANEHRAGLKMHLAHATLSADGIGTFLGRARNFRIDNATVEKNGKEITLRVVRADAFLDQTALKPTPKLSSPPGQYVMDLAESDPGAFGTSLVLKVRQEYRIGKDGTPIVDDETGDPLPPLWFPTQLHGVDVVSVGDATDSMLDCDGLRDSHVRQACQLLDNFMPNATRETIKTRLNSWLDRYLDLRFGEERKPTELSNELKRLRSILANRS